MGKPDMKWLKWEPAPQSNGDFYTPLDDVKARFETREILPERAWLVLHTNKEFPNWLKFAVIQWACSDGDGNNVMCELVFHGEGPGGKDHSLRECRHTYWGEDGYIFYPDGEVITAAFKALSEFYDEMA